MYSQTYLFYWRIATGLCLGILSFALQAEEIELEIINLKIKSRQVLLEREEGPFKPNESYDFSYQGGSCRGIIKKMNKKQILLEMDKDCKRLDEWEKGEDLVYQTEELMEEEMFEEGALTVKVTDFNLDKNLIVANVPKSHKIVVGNIFNLFAPDSRYCTVSVKKVVDKKFYLSSAECDFEFEIRPGLSMELQQDASKKKREQSSRLESYYFGIGIFMPKISYGGSKEKSFTDSAEQSEATSRTTVGGELSLYFPGKNSRWWWGIIGQATLDSYKTESKPFQIFHTNLAGSVLGFWNKKKSGIGPYLRLDGGLATQLATAVKDSETGENLLKPLKVGFGVLAGGGWAFAVGKNVFTPWFGYSYRKTSDSDAAILELGLSYLF